MGSSSARVVSSPGRGGPSRRRDPTRCAGCPPRTSQAWGRCGALRVERNPLDNGFVPQPKRWRVEQTHGILIRHRRLVRGDLLGVTDRQRQDDQSRGASREAVGPLLRELRRVIRLVMRVIAAQVISDSDSLN
jgi:hypothetical protein